MNKHSLIFVIIGIIVLGAVGYFLFKPVAKQQPAQNQTNNIQPQEPQVQSNTVEESFNYVNENYEPKSIRVEQNQKVRLKISANVSDAAHLHGYNLSKSVMAGQEAIIEFTADKTGRFDLELENTGKSLGVIEVYPK